MLTIRAARPDDAPAILDARRRAILAKSAGHYPLPVLEAWAAPVTAGGIEHIQNLIGDRDWIIIVAEAEGEVIGFGAAVPSRRELRALYVRPNPIGRVGHVLLRLLEGEAFRICDALACDASLNAVEFYRANGYADEGAVDHLLGSGVAIPCIRMMKLRPGSYFCKR